jgi:hypothetical protein
MLLCRFWVSVWKATHQQDPGGNSTRFSALRLTSSYKGDPYAFWNYRQFQPQLDFIQNPLLLERSAASIGPEIILGMLI